MNRKSFTQSLVAVATVLATPAVWAHPGAHPDAWYAGLLHPLTGADHLLALLMMGAVAALSGKVAGKQLLLAIGFCFVMGFSLGLSWSTFDVMETLVLGSVAMLPLLALSVRKGGLLRTASLVLMALFGTSHGVVMGGEATGSLLQFGLGATVTSLVLCLIGYSGLRWTRWVTRRDLRTPLA